MCAEAALPESIRYDRNRGVATRPILFGAEVAADAGGDAEDRKKIRRHGAGANDLGIGAGRCQGEPGPALRRQPFECAALTSPVEERRVSDGEPGPPLFGIALPQAHEPV